MSISAILEFVLGLVLAIGTLRDVFDTVVVPGESRGLLKAARRIVFATLPLWRWSRAGRGGIPTSFAPFALVASFVLWMLLLIFAFGLMAYAIRDSFDPRLPSFPQALYVAGSGLVTVGQSDTDASGSARWLLLAAGFCGLAVMTMAVTYLLEVQGSIAARDTGILKLSTSSGQPPSALRLLERYAELDCVDQISDVLRVGRDWCATVMQSHAAHPSLIYFRSKGTGSGWPATLGALMDLALIIELLLEAPQWRGSAVLLREQGGRMGETLIDLLGLDHGPAPPSALEVEALLSRLAAAGYALRDKPDREGFCAQRGRYAGCTSRMAQHLAGDQAPLTP